MDSLVHIVACVLRPRYSDRESVVVAERIPPVRAMVATNFGFAVDAVAFFPASDTCGHAVMRRPVITNATISVFI